MPSWFDTLGIHHLTSWSVAPAQAWAGKITGWADAVEAKLSSSVRRIAAQTTT